MHVEKLKKIFAIKVLHGIMSASEKNELAHSANGECYTGGK